MSSIFYIIIGVFIALFFNFLDRYFSKHIFSQETLIIGKFVNNHSFLSATLVLLASCLLTLLFESTNKIDYLMPGVVSSFCIIWPRLYAPELLPTNAARNKKKIYLIFIWLILVFSVFSYVGGSLAERLMSPAEHYDFAPEESYPTWLIIGIAILFMKKYLNLK